ncbi:MAG TPA: GAP family protein [Thermomicrobiales bacterium]|nr:GAP family protein [Thermomicrobiales bacterium]
MELALLGTLGILALIDATSLGTLGVPVFLLTARTSINRILLFLGTITIFYFFVGIAIMLGLGALVDAVFSDVADALGTRGQGIAMIVAGGGLYLLSEWLERRRKNQPERSWVPSDDKARTFVMLALAAGLIEVATMVPYLSAIGILVTADISVGVRVLTLIGYTVLMVVPALLLIGSSLLLGRVMRPVLDRLGNWIRRNADTMLSWGVGAVGIILALNGLGRVFA